MFTRLQPYLSGALLGGLPLAPGPASEGSGIALPWVILLGITGAAVGSFLNLCIDRLPAGQSIVRPRSHCPHCSRPLAALDLVPVLNYLWLRGRCRYCRAPIPLRLPLVELATGLLFAYIAYSYLPSPRAWVLMLYCAFLLLVFFTDLEQTVIPNVAVYPMMALALALAPVGPPGVGASVGWAYISSLAGGGLGFVLFLPFALIRRGMGEGDMKLTAAMGLMLGWRLILAAILVGTVAGGVVAFALLIKRRRWGTTMPFGPFLAAGAMVALFAGQAILDWYLGLLA